MTILTITDADHCAEIEDQIAGRLEVAEDSGETELAATINAALAWFMLHYSTPQTYPLVIDLALATPEVRSEIDATLENLADLAS
jgi:hypothetical protein